MKKIKVCLCFLVTVMALQPTIGFSSGVNTNQCGIVECGAGMTVVTYAKRSDPYFACPTKALSDYTNFVLGLVALEGMFGKMPNISPTTGEPEMQGKTKAMLDTLRESSGASTFDQAVAVCKKGRSGLHVMVLNNPKDSPSIWVHSGKFNTSFWMPKMHADKLQ